MPTADSADFGESPRVQRRGILRILFILVCLPLVGWLLLSGWLASPYGREWVAKKIQGNMALETRVGWVSVTPWNGIRIQSLVFMQPTLLRDQVKMPLLRVDDLRILPIWSAWWHGRHDWTRLEMHRLRMVLAVELLSLLSKTEMMPSVEPLSAVSEPVNPALLAQHNTAGQSGAPPLARTQPGIGVLPQELDAIKSQSAPQPPPQPAPAAEKKAPVPVQWAPTSWVNIIDGEIIVLRAADRMMLARIDGLNGDIPVAGREASSKIRCAGVQLGDWSWKDQLEIDLDWKFPVLTQRLTDFEVCGVKGRVSSRLGILPGMPAQIAVEVIPQVLAGVEVLSKGRMKAGEVQSRFAFRGFLPSPGSWQADWMAELRDVEGDFAGRNAKFDRGRVVSVLRGGILSCLDARLVGDDLSLLGNASLLADGRGAGVVRLVAAPETLAGIAGRIFPAGSEVGVIPLSTPQRAALDIEAHGIFPKFQVQARANGQ